MRQLAHFILTSVVLLSPTFVNAQWQTDGVPVSTVADINFFDPLVMAEDGVGGSFIAWLDRRSGSHYDVYAQRLNAGGVAQWAINGIAVCPIVSQHQYPKIVSDGSNGAIVIWNDFRSGTSRDIYAQQLDGAGVPQWTTDGVPICTAADNQWLSAAISDGAGGAFIVWDDRRNGSDYDVYVQRVSAAGVPLWTSDGVALCTQVNDQRFPRLVSSGDGAIVAWNDERSTDPLFFNDIYAQRVDAAGTPQWSADGVGISVTLWGQSLAAIVTDGAVGAIVAWVDSRSGFQDPFAQRIDVNGVTQWANNGVLVNFNSTDDIAVSMTPDGAGGAIVAWTYRNDAFMTQDIALQRLDGSGVAQWSEYGVPLCTTSGNRQLSSMIPDGAGGTIIAYNDVNGGYFDVFAQRVTAAGVAQWGADGAAICTAANSQPGPAIASDGAGGAILAWYDRRSGVTHDVYAHHVSAAGVVPTAIDRRIDTPSLLVSKIYPNPFSATTIIDLNLDAPTAIVLEVFDVAGRYVRGINVGESSGAKRVEFDGHDNAGNLLPSGVYFCRIEAVGETITRKIVIAR